MTNFVVSFSIKSEKNCPLYDVGEVLMLSEKTLLCPPGKEVCLILVRDLTALLFTFLQNQPFIASDYRDTVFNCSGCKGLIKFGFMEDFGGDETNQPGSSVETSLEAQELLEVLAESKIFKALSRGILAEIVKGARKITLQDGSYLLQKGEENQNIYIVLSGRLVVEDEGLLLATIDEYEICGEMSYLGGDTAISSVRADGTVVVLAIGGEVFGKILGNNPAIQSYMARLLTLRLRRTTENRARELSSCMTGRIDEILPAEILQIFHMHQKTGQLVLEMRSGKGLVCFKEGQIVHAVYAGLTGETAVYKILAEESGTYRFTTGLQKEFEQRQAIADFMMLLMEGVRLADEEDGQF